MLPPLVGGNYDHSVLLGLSGVSVNALKAEKKHTSANERVVQETYDRMMVLMVMTKSAINKGTAMTARMRLRMATVRSCMGRLTTAKTDAAVEDFWPRRYQEYSSVH